MQDREPTYPGRVTLTPVYGLANTYDMERADRPLQQGTPINKASLLKDATAALFGKTNAAVPDDILSLLSKSMMAQITGKYTKTTIGTLAAGKTITLNVDGAPIEFVVVHQGKPSAMYDDSCDGSWLLMKDIYENRAWDSSNSNSYKASTIHSYLNGTFLGLLDSNTQEAVKQVKIPYVNGTGGSAVASGANGLPAKIFLLSGYEVGWTTSDNSDLPVDGAKLDYFTASSGGNSKRIANFNGSASRWWLRSPYIKDTNNVWTVYPNGSLDVRGASAPNGIRPALILPSTFVVYTDSSGNIYTEQEYETKITDVLGNLIAIPAGQIKDGVKIATGSYTGTGTYGPSNPNSLTFEFVPKLVIVSTDSSLHPYNSPGSWAWSFIYSYGAITTYVTSSMVYFALEDKTLKWYSESVNAQLNGSGTVYFFVAIG